MSFDDDIDPPYLGLSMMYLMVRRALKASITMKQARNNQ